MKIKLNFLILIFFSCVAILFNALSKGDYQNIMPDFPFYFNRLIYIRDYNLPINEWFSSSLEYPSDLDLYRVGNFVPTPFYTIIFLGPLLLHGSSFLFAIQGVGVAYLTFKAVQEFLKEIYHPIKEWLLNLILILGSLNPAFLKDALTSSPIAICNLFIIYGFKYKDKTYIASLLFAFAAMTRSSYFIYWIVMLFATLISSRSFLKKFIKITFPSLIVYFIFNKFFYSTYPGSGYAYMFFSGMKGMDFFDNYFISILSKYYEVSNIHDIAKIDISFMDFIRLIFTEVNLLYGVFVGWIFKILSSLGFLHMNLLWDMRSIFIQRFYTLIYFIFIMGPSFVTSGICLLSIPKKNNDFWIEKERAILIFSLLFILLHSIIWGSPRYASAVSWMYVAFFVRFILWLRSKNCKNIN